MRYLQYLKIPYKYRGRDFAGADCYGLVRLFYLNELGIDLEDFTKDYDEQWFVEHDYFRDLYAQYGFQLSTARKFGNLVFLRNATKRIGHVGVILDDSSFLHMTALGCSIDSLLVGPWRRRIDSIYTFAETV